MAKNEMTQKMALINAIEVLAPIEEMEATVTKLKAMLTQVEKKKSGSGPSEKELAMRKEIGEKVL